MRTRQGSTAASCSAFSGVTIALTSGMGWIGQAPNGAGRGSWDMATQVTLSGFVSAAPYAHIRLLENGQVRTVLLGCETKCGARERLDEIAFSTGSAQVRGSILERDGYRMMATASTADWITPDAGVIAPPPQWRKIWAKPSSPAKSSTPNAGSAPCGPMKASATKPAPRCASPAACRLISACATVRAASAP
jgi:hypothetical protein